MNIMLAQAQLDSVPAAQVKWFFVILFALICVVGILVGIYVSLRKPEKQKIDDNPPVEVRKAAKRFNHDLNESRYAEHERRIAALEAWRNEFIPRMEHDRRELVKENEERASRIHAHIEKDRVDMDKKIDGIFDRILQTLRNMGKI